MLLTKKVSFKKLTETVLFFYNQPANLVLENFQEELNDEITKEQTEYFPVTSYCEPYCPISPFDENAEEPQIEPLKFITMCELSTLDVHIIL